MTSNSRGVVVGPVSGGGIVSLPGGVVDVAGGVLGAGVAVGGGVFSGWLGSYGVFAGPSSPTVPAELLGPEPPSPGLRPLMPPPRMPRSRPRPTAMAPSRTPVPTRPTQGGVLPLIRPGVPSVVGRDGIDTVGVRGVVGVTEMVGGSAGREIGTRVTGGKVGTLTAGGKGLLPDPPVMDVGPVVGSLHRLGSIPGGGLLGSQEGGSYPRAPSPPPLVGDQKLNPVREVAVLIGPTELTGLVIRAVREYVP